MANTSNIQILRSYTTSTPASLLDGQLAYSFKSGDLFIGANSTIVTVGGKSVLDAAQRASDTANGAQANVTNSILLQAGINQTQNAQTVAVNQYAQSAFALANTVSFDLAANAAIIQSIIQVDNNNQAVNDTQNTEITGINYYAQSAFSLANTVSFDLAANVAYNQGINNYQNTTTTQVNQYVSSAYAQANSTLGVDVTQNTRIQSIEIINNQQNTTLILIQNTDVTQNTRLNSLETVNLNQNTSISVIQGVDLTQNTRLNSIETVSNNQNTSIDYINAVNLWQNTEITAVNNFAKSAYNSANTNATNLGYVNSYAASAYALANTDATNIVSVNQYAASAYALANSLNIGSNANSVYFLGIADTQNVRLQSIETINVNQNTSIGIIQGVDNTQNTRLNSLETVNVNQNTAITVIQGVDNTQNTNITTANNAAWAAFTKANNALANTTGTFAGDLTVTGNVITGGAVGGNITGANVIYANTFSASISYVFSDSTIQTTAAASNAYTQAAAAVANSASANTIVTQGVDATQNTRLNSIETVNVNQNTSITVIQGVDVTQNTRLNSIESINQEQNTRIQSVETVNIDQNNAISIIQGVNLTQNTQIGGIQGVDLAQNNSISIIQDVNLTQNTRLNSIETVNNNQNTSISILEGVDLGQNTRITEVNQFAQSAYDNSNTKFSSSGGTITGSVFISANGNLTVTGNLYVQGNTTSFSTDTLAVKDPMILLADGNYSTDLLDIGFAGSYNDTANAHTGLFRESSTKEWYLFQGYTPEVSGNNNINISDPSFRTANLNANEFHGNLIGSTAVVNGRELGTYVQLSFDTANQTNQYAQSGYQTANSAQANTIVTQGVDNTQNTRLDSIETVNIDQNTSIGIIQGVDLTQNTRLDSIETVNVDQNTAISIIQGVDLTQNNNITYVNQFAQSGYDQANTATGLAQASFNAANNVFPQIQPAYDKANAAFIQANTATNNTIYLQGVDDTQNTRLNSLETVNVNQNTSISVIQGVDLGQNTRITEVNQYAVSAYNTANNALPNTAGVITVNSSSRVYVSNSIAATSNSTGALVVQGGVGIGGTLYSGNVIITGTANGITFPDGTRQTTAGVAVDQFARDTANSAQANTVVTQGVDATQNTNITSVNQFAQSGYNQANTANTRAYNSVLRAGDTMTGALNISSTLIGTSYGDGALNINGNLIGNNAVYFGGTAAFGTANGTNKFSNALISAIGNNIGYAQLVLQNGNASVNSSTDFVATADNGSDADTYIDMGINSSSYNQTGFGLTGPNDGYLYVSGNTSTGGGNLVLSTFTPKDIVFSLNGGDEPNEYARFQYNTGLKLKRFPLTFSDSTSQNTAAAPANYTQSAFDKANTASANTIIIQGVDLAQNSAISIIQGVDLGQNSTITAVNQFAASAFNKANNALANTSGTIFGGNLNVSGNVAIGNYITFPDGSKQNTAIGIFTSSISLNRQTYTATAAQTTFAIAYTAPFVQVVINGSNIDPSEYTATNGTTVVLSTGTALNDIVDLIGYTQYSNTNTTGNISTLFANTLNLSANIIPVTISSPATLYVTGGQVTSGNSFFGDNLYVTANLGVGTPTPNTKLHVSTTDGDIFIGDIITGSGSTDAGVLMNGGKSIRSGMFTEVDGNILSYGINTSQIDSGYDYTKVGGVFRFDTRPAGTVGDARCFVIKNRQNNSNTELSAFVIDLSNNNTYLTPSNGNVAIGSTRTPNTKLHVFTDGEILRLDRGTNGQYITFTSDSISSKISANATVAKDFAIINEHTTSSVTFGTNNTERMRIDANGAVGIGTSALTGFNLNNSKTITGAVTSYAYNTSSVIQSDVTNAGIGYNTFLGTAASAFTVGAIRHFNATQGTIGATSVVTNQYGFILDSSLSGATNNYGFYSGLAAATGRYNLYMAGSADNYLNGNLGIGGLPSTIKLDVIPTTTNALRIRGNNSAIAYMQFTDQNASVEWAYIQGIAGSLDINHTGVVRLLTGGSERVRVDASGNVSIGVASTTYKLQVNGSFAATTKSFVIPHPTKEGRQLRYGSLEGPENGVYVRGKLKDSNTIELPDYWTKLVDPDSITVQITPIGKHQKLYVKDIVDNKVIIGNENLLSKSIDCFYVVFAERADVEKLVVEI